MTHPASKDVIITFKPYGLYKAKSPEELASLGIYMCPEALPKEWGPDAPQRYVEALGFTYHTKEGVIQHSRA